MYDISNKTSFEEINTYWLKVSMGREERSGVEREGEGEGGGQQLKNYTRK